MRLTKNLNSTAIRFFRSEGFDAVFFPDLVNNIRTQYNFLEYPQSVEAMTLESGLKFQMGVRGGKNITKLELFPSGVSIQAPMTTDELEEVLEEVVSGVAYSHSISFKPASPVAIGYMSAVEFEASPQFTELTAKFTEVANVASEMVRSSGAWLEGFDFHGISLGCDPQKSGPIPIGRFAVERRLNRPFEQNIFYSEAPVKTADHLKLLEMLEKLF